MQLAALYIENHFLFSKPQIINFGGKYFYFIKEGNIVSKEMNDKYIHNFYSSKNVNLVSAIVGKNGAGKTSLLNIIIETLNESYGYNSILIFENGGKIYIDQNRIRVNFNFKYYKLNIRLHTYFYSPHFDYQIPKSGVDLSFNSFVEQALEGIETIHKSSRQVNPIRQIKMKNWERLIEFTNSDLGNDCMTIFKVNSDDFNRITFTRYLIEVDKKKNEIIFWNTPRNFQEIIQIIYNKLQKEAEFINGDRPKGFNIVDLQKKMLKNYFLMDFLCIFIKLMEQQNTYLEEGFIEGGESNFIRTNEKEIAKNMFFNFLNKHYFTFESNKSNKKKLLPTEITIEMIETVFLYIDKTKVIGEYDTRYFDWNDRAIHLNKVDTLNLLKLQNIYIQKINEYYDPLIEISELRNNKLNFEFTDFLNFEPSNKTLSTGETALLNLFSSFYAHLTKLKSIINVHNRESFFIILLDEADLGFHPDWKKKYLSSILKYFEKYFEQLKANCQIIFTTHDPLTLSDILNYNIVYLGESKTEISFKDEDHPSRSFGANITELLADSFFIHDGLIGDFASKKINETINWLKSKSVQNSTYHKSLIENIGEPIVKEKLLEMYSEKMKDTIYREFLKKEIELLKIKLNNLK